MPAFHRRADGRLGRGDGRPRRRPAIERPARRATSSTSTSGCAAWRCGSRCGRCSASIPTRRARAPPRPSTSSARSASTGSTSTCACCAGRGSPWSKMVARGPVLDEIVYGEIARRRAAPDPERQDILSLLLGRPRRGGRGLLRQGGPRPGDDPDVRRPRHLDLDPDLHDARARSPPRRGRQKLGEEQDRVLGGETPNVDRLEREMPYLDMVIDEVLRLYPPAWIGPRRAVRDFEFGGHAVPSGAYVNYCSWASHRIPEVFPEPEAFVPERFTGGAQGGAAARRLRPLRRRQPDLHRQALRPDRGEAGRDDAAAAAAPRRAARPHDDRAPDADPLAARAVCRCGYCRARERGLRPQRSRWRRRPGSAPGRSGSAASPSSPVTSARRCWG